MFTFIPSLAAMGFLAVVFSVIIAKILLSKPKSVKGFHALITGGSSGIGKCIAIDLAHRGCNITLLARDESKLEEATAEVARHAKYKDEQKVQWISVDISKNYNKVEAAVQKAEETFGPVTILINCAGFAIAARYEETSPADIRRLLEVNCLGTLFVTRAVLPSMKSGRKGNILITSSQAGLLGVFGYGAYSASKFALRGLAETLRAEVKPYNISVTIAFPPDTDTPGFAIEEKGKPLETTLISKNAGLMAPHDVANPMVQDLLSGNFYSSVGIEGSFLTTVCAGMTPPSNILQLTFEVLTMGFARIIAAAVMLHFDRIIAKCAKEKVEDKKQK